DNRIDAVTLHALQPLLHHRLLAAELVAEFVAHRRPPPLRKRDRLDLFLAQWTGQDLQKFTVDRHRARSVAEHQRAACGERVAGHRPLASWREGSRMTPAMKVLHVAAGNRWTGAAAPAFAEVAALREAGVDAHFAYVGGYKLEAKIGRLDFTHSIIAKAQNPFSFLRSARALDRLVGHHGFDVVHAHLTYDHWLARTVAADRNGRLARTFHSRRVVGSDPFTRSLIARSALICVTSDALRDAAPIRNLQPLCRPPPVNRQEFTPDGPDARERYGLSPD